MNYKESTVILEEIKKAKKILLNCHRGPDPDAIGSCLAMYKVLKRMVKKVEIICPSERLYENVNYLKDFTEIKTNIVFSSFNFSIYDLFIVFDSSSWEMVSGDKKSVIPKLPIINIDHHETNTFYSGVNLVDKNASSVGEMLLKIFVDWEIEIDADCAACLMAAIVGDTGAFRYANTTPSTFEAIKLLTEKGANKDQAIFHIFRSNPSELVKFWGVVLSKLQIDKKYKFVWSAISYKDYEKMGKPENAKETAASYFTQIVHGTDFGFIAVEQEKGILSISFRSRTGFDTSKIALELGGGGHIWASGAKVEGLPFNEAVKKVLKICRMYAKMNR